MHGKTTINVQVHISAPYATRRVVPTKSPARVLCHRTKFGTSAHRTRADPTEGTEGRTVEGEGDNNYNSCGIVGKLQAERTIQYRAGRSGALKMICWFPSRRYAAVISRYETAGGPVLEQDCDYVAGLTDATKAFFILKTSYASTVHK